MGSDFHLLVIEIAWAWLRFQPESKLIRWFEERFAIRGKRMRRIGIVAVARKLLNICGVILKKILCLNGPF